MKIADKPAGSQWTDEQWQAIDASGNNILVAAAAGSGKTAVLVERIIRKVTNKDNPIDVDRLLIATFTNAAASEMRKRIGEAIEKELVRQPSSLHLRRQLSLINRANISTLHSFCMEVIRQYYYNIDIDPAFRIADDTEAELLREEVMEQLFEEEYGKADNDVFYDVVDRYSSDRSDLELQVLIRKLYDFSRAHPSPAAWLLQLRDNYQVPTETVIDELPWTKDLMEDLQLQLAGCIAMIKQGLEITKQPGGPDAYAQNFDDDLQMIEKLQQANSWNALYEQFADLKFSTLKRIKKDDAVDSFLQEKAKQLREKVKKRIGKLQKELFRRSPDAFIKDIQEMAPIVTTLVDLVLTFSRRYQEVKKEKGLVDFADLEHFALDILAKPTETGKYEPTEAALDYQEKFTEVLVDEYQDTNLVQETILRLVTKENNMFMVGDVKQSIYRFRLAEPGLFLHKYKEFVKFGDGSGWKIDLARNFRSRAEVLDATNFIFRQTMDEEVGEIAYDDDAELKLGAAYPDYENTKTELLLVNKGEPVTESSADEDDVDIDEEEELETAQLESRFIAKQIKELIESSHQVYDHKLGQFRNIAYRDIVILMRSMPWAQTMTEEFKQYGIPVYADLASGYFEATEVAVMMSLLKIIDNPYQDIPFASVLRSPIVGLDEEQLAQIRVEKPKGLYYEAFCKALQSFPNGKTKETLQQFAHQLQTWRTLARQGSLSQLIWQLYRDTGYYDFVGGIAAGKQRQANLRALYERARRYEETSFRGLFRFLRFIERMQERGDDLGTARALGEQEDVVRMMTIHKSKGLEFPVVFVAGLAKPFNMMDMRSKVLLHKELGFGSKYIHPKLRITYPSLPQLAMKKRMHHEMIAEEMRVLYVALTRAKEKLYLVGTVKDAQKALAKWSMYGTHEQWLLPAYDRIEATCYLDWVGPAVMRHKDAVSFVEEEGGYGPVYEDTSRWSVSIIEKQQLVGTIQDDIEKDRSFLQAISAWEQVESTGEDEGEVKKRLEYKYPHHLSTISRSKQSVTEIKRDRSIGEEHQEIPGFKATLADRPRFLQQQSLTPAEKGTAMHLVMQHVPLNQEITIESVKNLLDRMVHHELLTEQQASIIEPEAIVEFFESEIGKRLLTASFIRREIPFSFSLPAHEAYKEWPTEQQETVLVQGVIDCLFKDEFGVVLLDYKTDAILTRFKGGFAEAEPILKERYQVQIELYSKALEGIVKESITEKYLFFFDGSHLVEMK